MLRYQSQDGTLTPALEKRKSTFGDIIGAWNGANNSTASNAIQAPTRTSLGQSLQTVQSTGILPKYQPVQFNPISGMDSSYYQNLSDQAAKRLKQQYFDNNDSLQRQLNTQMNRRGLIGSGIEAGSTNQLYKDFGSQLADVQSNLLAEQAKNDFETNKFNTQLGLDTAFKNQDLQGRLAELALGAAGDEARNATTFDTGIFEQQIGLEKAKADQLARAIDSMSELAGNRDVSAMNREQALGGVFDYANNMGVNLPSVDQANAQVSAQQTQATQQAVDANLQRRIARSTPLPGGYYRENTTGRVWKP